MAKYRKKPIIINAVQWNPDNLGSWVSIRDLMYPGCRPIRRVGEGCKFLEIETLEGNMTANPGDYIIKGVEGELYPCKPDIFEKTYELVEEEIWGN